MTALADAAPESLVFIRELIELANHRTPFGLVCALRDEIRRVKVQPDNQFIALRSLRRRIRINFLSEASDSFSV